MTRIPVLRRPPVRALLALAIVSASACALDEGSPWGELRDASLIVLLDAPSERLVTSHPGAVQTLMGYNVAVEQVELRASTLTLTLGAGGDVLSFDPSRPPPGYTNCHHGHCHTVEGNRIVDYADIEAELRLVGPSGDQSVVWSLAGAALLPGFNSRATPAMVGCEDGCTLERGRVNGASLEVVELRVSGRVWDRREGERARLAPLAGGHPFDISVDNVTLVVVGEGRVERGERLQRVLETTIALPVSLFDDIDWAEMPSEQDLLTLSEEGAEALTQRLLRDTSGSARLR